jgi:hypothetical protein
LITLPTKFQTENNKAKSKPVVLVKLGDSVLENIQSSQGDWQNNTAESQVDYATQPGDVILEADTVPSITQVTDNNAAGLNNNIAWQSFKQVTSAKKTVNTVQMKVVTATITGATFTFTCGIYDAKLGTLITNTYDDQVVGSSSGTVLNFDFSADQKELAPNVTYWVALSVSVSGSGNLASIRYQDTKPYANGQLDITGAATLTDIGDAYFTISFTGDYYLTSGSITTQIIDLGETPAVDGEWQMLDQTPSDYGTTAITYTARGSTDNFVASDVNIGTVADGDTISSGDWYRYYKITASLTTTDESETPVLESMGVSFVSYINFQNQITELGYEQSLKKISSLTTEIDDFALTQIGQLSLTIGQTEQVSNYFYTVTAKNKPVKVKLGFNETGWIESDYIDFYTGVIDDYRMTGRDFIVNIKDATTNWSFDVPREISTAGKQSSPTYQSDIVASADHHADVILDILQNYLSVRDSTIDQGSFEAVKTALPSYEVTRTIAGADAESADSLINELRILLGAYFVPQANGQIKIKLYDTTESAIGEVTINDNIGRPTWDAKNDTIINKTFVEYDYNTGTEVFDAQYIGIDSTSQSATDEVFTWEFVDYWTEGDTQGDSQQDDLQERILKRYAVAPPEIEMDLARKKLDWEVGDMITMSTDQAPSSDLSGISAEKYQIIRKNFDPLGSKISFTFLKVYT